MFLSLSLSLYTLSYYYAFHSNFHASMSLHLFISHFHFLLHCPFPSLPPLFLRKALGVGERTTAYRGKGVSYLQSQVPPLGMYFSPSSQAMGRMTLLIYSKPFNHKPQYPFSIPYTYTTCTYRCVSLFSRHTVTSTGILISIESQGTETTTGRLGNKPKTGVGLGRVGLNIYRQKTTSFSYVFPN